MCLPFSVSEHNLALGSPFLVGISPSEQKDKRIVTGRKPALPKYGPRETKE